MAQADFGWSRQPSGHAQAVAHGGGSSVFGQGRDAGIDPQLPFNSSQQLHQGALHAALTGKSTIRSVHVVFYTKPFMPSPIPQVSRMPANEQECLIWACNFVNCFSLY